MGNSNDPQSPMAAAMEWVARIMGTAIAMVALGLAGQWVDRKLGTKWIVLVGFALGIGLSIYYLLKVASPQNSPGNETRKAGSANQEDHRQ